MTSATNKIVTTASAVTAMSALGMLAACGWIDGESRDDGGAAPVPPSEDVGSQDLPAVLASFAPIAKGYTWYVMPFATDASKPNVYVLAKGTGETDLGAPRTIPGYHWPWELKDTRVFAKPAAGKVEPNKKALYGYWVPQDDAWHLRWPAVTGIQRSDVGHISAAGFVAVRPSNFALPHRVHFLAASSVASPTKNESLAPLVISHSAKTCGKGCVDFASFPALLDGPVSYARTASFEQKHGALTMTFAVTTEATKSTVRKLLDRTGNPATFSTLFDDLSRRWGKIAPAYQFHIGLQSGCGFQGLEHADSSALSFGMGCDATLAQRFLLLGTHELIHAWNAKAIFPREHARQSARAFPAERTKQLYFYEGFTEGLARLVISHTQAARVPLADRITLWNDTIDALASMASASNSSAGSPEGLSMAAPGQGYTFGAWLALRAAVEARKTRAPAEAYDAVLDVMARLAQGNSRTGAKAFALSSPAFTRYTFGAYEGVLKDIVHSTGYDRATLSAAFQDALGLAADAPFLGEFFAADARTPTSALLNARVADAAAALGLTTTPSAAGGHLLFAAPAQPAMGEPDHPERSPHFPL